MIILNNAFDISDSVYLRTDPEAMRIVTCIKYFKGGELMYQLSYGGTSSDHYEFEITGERNFIVS